MSDLINREDVIKCLQESGRLDDTNIDELIKTIPTAYSVDKVIEELLALNKNYNDGINLYEEVAEIPTEEAIKIVKQGGVFDDVCEWKLTDTRKLMPYKTSCGNEDLYDYSYKYCPYCGKKIKVAE